MLGNDGLAGIRKLTIKDRAATRVLYRPATAASR